MAFFSVDRLSRSILDVNRRFCRQYAFNRHARFGMKPQTPARASEGGRDVIRCHEIEGVAIPPINISKPGVTDVDGFLQHRLKDRQKVAWKTADDLEDFGGSGQLLYRLVAFARKPRDLGVLATGS
jgi:hypothetical protein